MSNELLDFGSIFDGLSFTLAVKYPHLAVILSERLDDGSGLAKIKRPVNSLVAGELGFDLHCYISTGTVNVRRKLKRQDNLALFIRASVGIFDVVVDLCESRFERVP